MKSDLLPSFSSSPSQRTRRDFVQMKSSSIQSLSRTLKASSNYQLTLALIKPTVASYQPDVSSILKELKSSTPLEIVRTKRLFWSLEEAKAFYKEHEGKFYYQRLLAGLTSGPSLALALAGEDAIKVWRRMLGPTKAYRLVDGFLILVIKIVTELMTDFLLLIIIIRAKWEEPFGLRARYGLGKSAFLS